MQDPTLPDERTTTMMELTLAQTIFFNGLVLAGFALLIGGVVSIVKGKN